MTEDELNLAERAAVVADRDALRDSQRRMAWFALFGMLLYPVGIFLCHLIGYAEAASSITAIAPTYFVSVAAIVAAFYTKDLLKKS